VLQIREKVKHGTNATFVQWHFTQVLVLRNITLKNITNCVTTLCKAEAIIHIHVSKKRKASYTLLVSRAFISRTAGSDVHKLKNLYLEGCTVTNASILANNS
jgi:hypothetical protein